jgi:hypothetical protein
VDRPEPDLDGRAGSPDTSPGTDRTADEPTAADGAFRGRSYARMGPPTDLSGTSGWPPAYVLNAKYNKGMFIVGPNGHVFLNGIMDPQLGGWTDVTLSSVVHTGGVDATHWGVEDPQKGITRGDFVTREGTTLIHYSLEIGVIAPWTPKRLDGIAGALRPAIAHLGPRILVAFQVDFERRRTYFNVFTNEAWTGWKTGPAGEIDGGLDAATLVEGGQPRLIRVVARRADRLVTSDFVLSPASMTPWIEIAGAPTDGAAGTPSIATFGPTTSDYELLTPSAFGFVWKRSFWPNGSDEAYEKLETDGFKVRDLDAVAVPELGRVETIMRTTEGHTYRVLYLTSGR